MEALKKAPATLIRHEDNTRITGAGKNHPLRETPGRFKDPEAEKHRWAESLQPAFTRKKCCEKPLSERLIKIISDICDQHPRTACITGSRILQRIIGIRYEETSLPDRDIYPVADIDVWLTGFDTLKEFYKELTKSLSKEYQIKENGSDNYASNLHIRPILFYGSIEDLHDKLPPLGKVDLSAPLLEDNSEYHSATLPKNNTTSRIKEKFKTTIAQAKSLPMYIQKNVAGNAPTLTDQNYLKDLEQTLALEDVKGNKAIKEKIKNNVLPLLLYFEATRKMTVQGWEPDEFSKHLLKLCQQYIPESVERLRRLLSTHYADSASILRDTPESLPTISQKCTGKRSIKKHQKAQPAGQSSQTTQPCNSRNPIEAFSLSNKDHHPLPGGHLPGGHLPGGSGETDTEQPSVKKINKKPIKKRQSDIAPGETSPDQPSEKQTEASTTLINKLHNYPRFPVNPGLPESITTAYLITSKELSAKEQGQLPPGVKLLKEVLSSIKTNQLTGYQTVNDCPLVGISHNPETIKTARKQLLMAGNIQHPYNPYLQSVLLPGSSTTTPAIKLLVRAAAAGVTGAALELIHRVLADPDSPVPVSAAMMMLKKGLERPDERQLSLRFQCRPIRPPFNISDLVITTLENHLKAPVTATSWLLLAQQLTELARNKKAEQQERLQLIAACAYNYGGDTGKACQYLTGFGKKSFTRMSDMQKLDWWIQTLPEQVKNGSLLRERPITEASQPGRSAKNKPVTVPPRDKLSRPDTSQASALGNTIQCMIRNDEAEFVKSLSRLPQKYASSRWHDWLPLCLPYNLEQYLPEKSGFEWLKTLPPLGNHWQYIATLTHNKRLKPDLSSSTIGEPSPVIPIPPPLSCAQALTDALNRNFPQQAAKIAEAYTILDWLLSKTLIFQFDHTESADRTSFFTSTTDYQANTQCLLIAEALSRLGAVLKETSPFAQLVLPEIDRKIRNTALPSLTAAIRQCANPYACWIYARLIRADLLSQLSSKQGEQQWYSQYLGFLLFAAMLGVDKATEDLLVELVNGRADGLMLAILKLLTGRYQRARHFKLDLGFNPLELTPFLTHVINYSGRSSQDWDKYMLGSLNLLIDEARACQDKTHLIRLLLIYATLHSHYSAKKSPCHLFRKLHDPSDPLVLPEALQISMIAYLDDADDPTRAYFRELLNNSADTPINKLMACWCNPAEETESVKNFEPLSATDCATIWPYLQWLPVNSVTNPALTQVNEKLPKKTRKTHATAKPLMLLLSLTLVSDAGRHVTFPEANEFTPLAGWLALYQLLKHGGGVDFIHPDQKDMLQVEKIRAMDSELQYSVSDAENADKVNPEQPTIGQLIQQYKEPTTQMNSSIMLGQLTPGSSTSFLQQLQGVPTTEPVTPYIDLLKGLAREVFTEYKPGREDDIIHAAKHFYQASLHGVDNAAVHYGRLALYPNSPLSLERMLDMFLLQYQRQRRHRIHFNIPIQLELAYEIWLILAVLTSNCLNSEGVRKPTQRLIKDDLLPCFTNLIPHIHNPELLCKIRLIIRICKHRSKMKLTRLNNQTISHASPPLLHQWYQHICISHRDDPDYTELRDIMFTELDMSMLDQYSGLRILPYIPFKQSLNPSEKKKYQEWINHPDDSLGDIPVLMGQDELSNWRIVICSGTTIPGKKINEHYRNIAQSLFIEAHTQRKPLTLPPPENEEQRSIGQYWNNLFQTELNIH